MAEFQMNWPLALGMGILAANQPSRAPVSFGGVLGQGGMQALNLMRQQQEYNARMAQQKLENDYRTQQMQMAKQRADREQAAYDMRQSALSKLTGPSNPQPVAFGSMEGMMDEVPQVGGRPLIETIAEGGYTPQEIMLLSQAGLEDVARMGISQQNRAEDMAFRQQEFDATQAYRKSQLGTEWARINDARARNAQGQMFTAAGPFQGMMHTPDGRIIDANGNEVSELRRRQMIAQYEKNKRSGMGMPYQSVPVQLPDGTQAMAQFNRAAGGWEYQNADGDWVPTPPGTASAGSANAAARNELSRTRLDQQERKLKLEQVEQLSEHAKRMSPDYGKRLEVIRRFYTYADRPSDMSNRILIEAYLAATYPEYQNAEMADRKDIVAADDLLSRFASRISSGVFGNVQLSKDLREELWRQTYQNAQNFEEMLLDSQARFRAGAGLDPKAPSLFPSAEIPGPGGKGTAQFPGQTPTPPAPTLDVPDGLIPPGWK